MIPAADRALLDDMLAEIRAVLRTAPQVSGAAAAGTLDALRGGVERLVREAAEGEREACAAACDHYARQAGILRSMDATNRARAASDLAAVIRARGAR